MARLEITSRLRYLALIINSWCREISAGDPIIPISPVRRDKSPGYLQRFFIILASENHCLLNCLPNHIHRDETHSSPVRFRS